MCVLPLTDVHAIITNIIIMITVVHRCGASGSMRACHTAGPGSIPGRDKFPGCGFSGIFLTCETNVRKLQAPRSPNIIWPSSSSSFHLRLVGMAECVLGVYCLSCLCCLGGGPGVGLIIHPGRPSMYLCGQKSMYVIHSLIPSPDRSWLCKARAAWVT